MGAFSIPQKKQWWNDMARENERAYRETYPLPFCLPEILHGLPMHKLKSEDTTGNQQPLLWYGPT